MLLRGRCPGDVVHRPGALQPRGLRRSVVGDESSPVLAASLPGAPAPLEAELAQERLARLGSRGVGTDRVEAEQRVLPRNLGVLGDQRLVADVADPQLMPQALRVLEGQRSVGALDRDPGAAEALLPEVERRRRGHPPGDRVDHAVPGPPARGAGELEERYVGAGLTLLVGVEDVVDGRIVLIDRLLDQAQAEDPGIEVDVVLGVRGDRGDVMDTFELHRGPLVDSGSHDGLPGVR